MFHVVNIKQAASYFGDADNVKLLLDHGAKINTEPIGFYGTELAGKFASLCNAQFSNTHQLLCTPEMQTLFAFF